MAVGVSSWRQRSNNAIPPAVKSTASYMNSILAKLEAKEHGYAEAIMLNEAGLVCEGTGENLFIVRDGVLSTPPLSDGLLEGIRCYKNPENGKSYVFRLRDHMERLHRSCKIACIELPYTVDELCDATVELIRKNNLPSCYIRPLVYRGYGVMGVDPTGSPTDVAIAVWPWACRRGASARTTPSRPR